MRNAHESYARQQQYGCDIRAARESIRRSRVWERRAVWMAMGLAGLWVFGLLVCLAWEVLG